MTLPYRQWAVVVHNGDVLGTIRLSAWERPEPRETPTGDVWDWTGEAEIEAADLLVDQSNRILYVTDIEPEPPAEGEAPEGKRLVVLAAVRHDFLPHVELRLQEHTGGR